MYIGGIILTLKKRYLFYIILIAGLLFLFYGIKTNIEKEPSGEAQVPLPTKEVIQQTQKQLMTFEGDVSDITMNSMVVIDTTGNQYIFSNIQGPVQEMKTGISIGDTVKVNYYGKLNNNDSAQQVEITKITVEVSSITNKANKILQTMTLEQKVGQMFYVRCPEEQAADKIKEYHLGGYILFGRDFQDKSNEDIITQIEKYQQASTIGLLIGVDEEGGKVNRISNKKSFRQTPFKASQQLYAEGGWERVRTDTQEKAELLKSLGINVNMAPVCDVSTNPSDYMYDRSFGKEAESTAQYVENVVEVMKENKMGSVLKHFPGYGNNVDTHTGSATDKRSYTTFENSDFLPFKSGIQAGADAVLVSHNIVTSMDEQYPASLSKNVHQILRQQLQFDGVIMTDDLYMDAIRKYTAHDEAAVLAVQAGNDLLCCTDFEIQIPAVIQAVKDGAVSQEQVDASVLRILSWKIRLGIIN